MISTSRTLWEASSTKLYVAGGLGAYGDASGELQVFDFETRTGSWTGFARPALLWCGLCVQPTALWAAKANAEPDAECHRFSPESPAGGVRSHVARVPTIFLLQL